MFGNPNFIQTPADMQNLFALAQEGKVPKRELAEKIDALLEMRYIRIPVIERSGKTVTTRYFSEVKNGDVTAEGARVTNVEHVEAPPDENAQSSGEGVSYEKTIITLSAALPSGSETLAVLREDNPVDRGGFDLPQINYILGVLRNE